MLRKGRELDSVPLPGEMKDVEESFKLEEGGRSFRGFDDIGEYSHRTAVSGPKMSFQVQM